MHGKISFEFASGATYDAWFSAGKMVRPPGERSFKEILQTLKVGVDFLKYFFEHRRAQEAQLEAQRRQEEERTGAGGSAGGEGRERNFSMMDAGDTEGAD